jgi:hypothetical protein
MEYKSASMLGKAQRQKGQFDAASILVQKIAPKGTSKMQNTPGQ